MAFKGWFRRLQPMQIYLVLVLTSAFFFVEIITSHVTHALTLLVNAYHMLCNIIALIGCIASIKYSNRDDYKNENSSDSKLENSAICIPATGDEQCGTEPSLSMRMKQSQSDRRMKNTFGWARINILTMLVCCVFLGSFCFSIQVEALQTLLHVNHTVTDEMDHLDAINQSNANNTEMRGMNHPLPVLYIGIAGIFLNIFCYLLIGGYTFHHGSSIRVTKNGEVIIKRNIATTSDLQEKSLSDTRVEYLRHPGRQGIREMCRDILGCVFVIVVSLLVYYSDPNIGKFIDPVIAIVSSISLFALSYPYMKESGLILLQTIPNHINIQSLQKELLEAFPGIVNVHDLHVWQLTGEKTISTAHIMFLDPTVYADIGHQVTAFFVEMGITQVTIQPEFQKVKPELEKLVNNCLIRCQVENCVQSRCCSDSPSDSELNKKSKSPIPPQLVINKKLENKEIIPSSPLAIDLKSFTQRRDDDFTDKKNQESVESVKDDSIVVVDENLRENNVIRDISANDEITCEKVNVTSTAKVQHVVVHSVNENEDKETV